MSAEPDKDTSRLSETPALGELLVERGLLTPPQLVIALDEQRWTGRRLGDIIVELGFTTTAAVAQALATQHGGLFKSEYGTAVGFDTGADPGPAKPPPVTERLVALDGGAIERAGAESDDTAAKLESELREAREQLQLLAAKLDAAIAERDAATVDVKALAARIDMLEEQAQASAPLVAEPQPADRHLVLVGASSGYKLLELPGPAPAAGSIVTLPDGAGASSSQLVVRVGRAPLPSSTLRCAYLLPD